MGTPLDCFVLGPDGEGVRKGWAWPSQRARVQEPLVIPDVDTHLTCLLSWKILFSPGLLMKAMGACAQEGEGIFPHLGLLNFISFLV